MGVAIFMANLAHLSGRLERRWAARYVFRTDLEIEWGSALLCGKTRDISANGVFVESADTLWVGARFTAHLALDCPVKLDCVVKRVEPCRGMALAVSLREAQHKQRYEGLLSALRSRPRS